MYVWVDALTNYITAAGFPDEKAPRWRYWPADVHIIGKDIVRFHAVYWPAFLMSAGVEPPRRVFAHGFLYNRGEKMSKSVGNVVDPFDLVKGYGVDQVRYFFLREAAFGQDGTYSHEAIVNRINADLRTTSATWSRSLSMIHKNCDAKVPKPGALATRQGSLPPPTGSTLRCARPWIAKASSTTSMPCGPWWRMPTATLPARSRGPSARPSLSAWARSST
jgi:methionyl-tRNA synthetase